MVSSLYLMGEMRIHLNTQIIGLRFNMVIG